MKNQKTVLKGFIEERCYATRYWNDGNRFARITKWNYDVDSSYEIFNKIGSKYENTEWIEKIVHRLSSRGIEASESNDPIWAYDKQTDKIITQ
jgi:hypothetical protein